MEKSPYRCKGNKYFGSARVGAIKKNIKRGFFCFWIGK